MTETHVARQAYRQRPRRQPLIRASHWAACSIAILMVAVGMTAFLAYPFGWHWMWRPLDTGGAIHPFSAGCFTALGVAIFLARPQEKSRLSLAIALTVATAAAALLLGIATGHGDYINTASPFTSVLDWEADRGRAIFVLLPSAVTLFLLSIAIALLRSKFSAATLFVDCVASLAPVGALLGYAYGVPNSHADMGPLSAFLGFLGVLAIAGRTAHRTPLKSVLTINLPGRFIRTQIVTLIGLCLFLALIAARSGFDNNAQSVAIEAAVAAIVILLTLINAAFRWQQEDKWRKTQHRRQAVDPFVSDLDGSWSRGELYLLYQPQIRLRDDALIGVEALVRWNHPQKGMISPDSFILIAEQSGLIIPLGTWVFEAVCAQVAQWQHGPLSHIVVAVNVSALQLEREGSAERLIAIQTKANVPASKIVIEVTESTLVARGSTVVESLRLLNEAGMLIAIDDFGTGFSSLSSLRLLPSRYLKVDRSFIQDIPHNLSATMIVKAIVGMGRGLGMRVIAEGVETPEQADYLKKIGCEKAQGYLYGKPMAADDILNLLSSRAVSIER